MRKRLFFIVAFLLVNLCASTLCAQYPNNQSNDQPSSQLPYRSATNTNYGTSSLNSFMRNSSQRDGLAKYLTNNNSTSAGSNYPSFSSPNQTSSSMSPNQNITSSNLMSSSVNNRTQTPMSSQSQTSTQGLSSMSGSSSYSQNLKDYNLQPVTQAKNNSYDIAKKLDELTRQINSLEKKFEASNNNAPASRSQSLTMSNNRPIEVTSSSEMFSGYNNNSESFLRNNINPNPYQGAIDSSSSRISQPGYNPSNFSNQNQQSSSNDSLDDIRAKLDELSRSIGTIQTNNNNTQGYETGNIPSRSQQNNSSFRSYSQSQFDKYYSTAQNQLLRGNYMEAADSFTLASIYEPENANCYAGHGHALFAAGQYVSSALYIIRAIELNPEYIQANIDLVPSIGNRNIIDMRTSELEQLLKKAPASGLQILTAYVYYRTGKLANAKQIINAVYQEMPNSRAAVALKIAIDSKTNYSR